VNDEARQAQERLGEEMSDERLSNMGRRALHESYCEAVKRATPAQIMPLFIAQATVIANYAINPEDCAYDTEFLELCHSGERLLALNTIGPVE
jgi:hypothetical protein